jgi:hypothetical protein
VIDNLYCRETIDTKTNLTERCSAKPYSRFLHVSVTRILLGLIGRRTTQNKMGVSGERRPPSGSIWETVAPQDRADNIAGAAAPKSSSQIKMASESTAIPNTLETKRTRKRSRIRPGIFDFQSDLSPKLVQLNPKMPGTVPASQHPNTERLWPDFVMLPQ